MNNPIKSAPVRGKSGITYKMADLLIEDDDLHNWSPGEKYFIKLIKHNTYIHENKTLVQLSTVAKLMDTTIEVCKDYWERIKNNYKSHKVENDTKGKCVKYLDGTLNFIDDSNFGKQLQKSVNSASLAITIDLTDDDPEYPETSSTKNKESLQDIPKSSNLITQDTIEALLQKRQEKEPGVNNSVVKFVSQVIAVSLEKQIQASIISSTESPSPPHCNVYTQNSHISRPSRKRNTKIKPSKRVRPPAAFDPNHLTEALGDIAAELHDDEPANKKYKYRDENTLSDSFSYENNRYVLDKPLQSQNLDKSATSQNEILLSISGSDNIENVLVIEAPDNTDTNRIYSELENVKKGEDTSNDRSIMSSIIFEDEDTDDQDSDLFIDKTSDKLDPKCEQKDVEKLSPLNNSGNIRDFLFEVGEYVSRRFTVEQQEMIRCCVSSIISEMEKKYKT